MAAAERCRGVAAARRDGARSVGPARAALGALALILAAAGCDDQMKWVPWFSHMSEQSSVETYQEEPRPPVEGTVPVDGERSYGLLEADTLLSNPLAGTDEEIARGERLFGQFCTPCHGPTGQGDGRVVMPQQARGIPFTPALDLHGENARALSDGYIFGIITEGRGLMPSYRRIPPDARWYIVSWVRALQARGAEGEEGATAAGSDRGGGAEGAGAEGEGAATAAGGAP